MHKLFFIQRYFLPAAFFSLAINLLLLAPSIYMLQLYDRVLATRSKEALWLLSMLLLVALVVMGLIEIVRSRLLVKANNAIDLMYGPTLFRSMAGRAVSPEGNQYFYALSDLYTIRTFLTGHGILGLFDAPWLPLYLLVITAFDPWLGLTAALGALTLFGLIWITERATRGGIEESTRQARLASRVIDSALRNAEVILGMGMGRATVARWSAVNDEVLQRQMALTRVQSLLQACVRSLRQGLQVAMLVVGAWLVVRQHASPGIMVAASILLGKALSPIEQLSGSWRSLIEARAAWQRLQGLAMSERETALELPAPRGQIDVERVVYAFPGQRQAVIKGISLNLAPGECLGIIGPSGSGKTTLLRLLLGIWQPQSGTVRLDGADIGRIGMAAQARHIGYLPQDVELFAGSVADNIARMGPVDATAVVAAAQAAGVHDLILRLPQGYETPIGEAGAALSGGQRQRIALARALHGQPCLLVLDEPNSNLDAEGESALQQALAQAKARGITVVLVGHRPSMMRSVDKLAVLRDGALDAFGPRDAVLARLQAPQGAVAAVTPVSAVR